MRNGSNKLQPIGNVKLKIYINQIILIYKIFMYISALRAQLAI